MDRHKKVTEYLMRLKNGEDCFEEFYKYASGYVQHIAYIYTFDKSLIKDVIAITFTRIIIKLDKYDESYSGFSWLCKIAHNESICMNRREVRPETSLEDLTIQLSEEPKRDSPELLYDVERAIESLDEESRKLIEYRIYKEMTYEQIREVTGMSIGTIHNKLKKCYRILKEKLSRD